MENSNSELFSFDDWEYMSDEGQEYIYELKLENEKLKKENKKLKKFYLDQNENKYYPCDILSLKEKNIQEMEEWLLK